MRALHDKLVGIQRGTEPDTLGWMRKIPDTPASAPSGALFWKSHPLSHTHHKAPEGPNASLHEKGILDGDPSKEK